MSYLEKTFNLKDKVAIITGGLGILGTEYAKVLVQAGAKVAIFDLEKPEADHELVVLSEELSIMFYQVDVTDKNSIKKATEQVAKDLGSPNVLINNAAIDIPPDGNKETFENYSLEKWEKVLKVNLTGTMITCQVIGGLMAENKGGSIINISSIYGVVSPDQSIYQDFIKPVSYSASKSGIMNLTRYLATYWANKNVRVNTLTPGGVLGGQDQNFIKKYSGKAPLGRMANKDEYNGAILFLASDASSYMTGSNLVIDGGWTAL